VWAQKSDLGSACSMARKLGDKSWPVGHETALVFAVITFALLVRFVVCLHSYSGGCISGHGNRGT